MPIPEIPSRGKGSFGPIIPRIKIDGHHLCPTATNRARILKKAGAILLRCMKKVHGGRLPTSEKKVED